jgi:4-amino-4-deoxy-L-arabinose transferase-like glycosyltransferase
MSASHPAAAPVASPVRRTPPLAWVLAASLALSLFIALKLPLLDPDEGRNAEVAREMAVTGELVIPHLAGMPYLDKPPGFFWAAALSIRAFGHTPLAARLPSIVASLALLLLVGRAATRAGGVRFGWLAAALLAAAPLYAGLSAYVIFDMMLALCVTVVWLGVTGEVEDTGEAIDSSRSRTWRRVAMFAAIAAGLSIKGPVMLAWALGGSLGAALLTRSRAALAWLAWWPGWLIALVPPGAWFVAASARFPEYPHYAFVEESFERMATGSFHRQQPWWFVPAVLVGGALPWSLMTRWSRERLETSARGVRLGAHTAVGFMLFTLVFFTLSHSKLVTYVLPALPPMAWSAAAMWSEPRWNWMHRLRFVVLVLFSPALAILGVRFTHGAAGPPASDPLAAAIARSGGDPVRYEGCYSPGADFLRGSRSALVSRDGHETTSNYQMRYRDALKSRGLWTALDQPPLRDSARTVVRPFHSDAPRPPGETVHSARTEYVVYRVRSGVPADSIRVR